jgi:hypothetical protein
MKPRPGIKEMDRLVAGVDPRAKLPSTFGLWSEKMQLIWLRQHQKRTESQPRLSSGQPGLSKETK